MNRVDTLRAPREVQSLQDEFVDAARESVAAVGQAAEAVEAGNLSCGTAMNHRIYGLPSTTRAEHVLEELGRKGYVLELNSQD